MDITDREFMAIVASRRISNEDVIFCGTGISLLAAMTAKRINAPECKIFYETGAIDPELEELPMSVADPRVMYRSSINAGLFDSFCYMQNPMTGKDVLSILGAAQIDKCGNLNTTCIGDYGSPEIRFPGSGGSCDAASLTGGYLVFTQQEKRRFVEQLDYLTSPGYLSGDNSREEVGYPGGGPEAVITDMAVFEFDGDSGEMYLSAFRAGTKVDDILNLMEFKVDASRAKEMDPVPEKSVEVLREEVDPQRLILK
ncbi:MAG: CoA-transferase [Candidatus Bipolaricaulota bacterium]